MYRSAQLTGDELQKLIDEKGINTVINLRGQTDKEWYHEQKAVVEANGIKHIDIRMSAGRIPHRKQLIKLLDAFKATERPLLIHCRAGADRAGLASAIYAYEYMGKSREEAIEQLSFKYFHLEWSKPNKRYFFELYGGEDWAREFYDPCAQTYEYYDQDNYCGREIEE